MLDNVFESACVELPESVFTLNFHLLCHLKNQVSSAGPVYNYSMFPFEAAMKKFKLACHGTVSYDKQIVENFLLYKCLLYDVKCDRESYSDFVDLFNDFGIHENNSCFLSEDRYKMNGGMYHSVNFKKRKRSCSHMCILKSGEFCEIVQFEKKANDHFAVVNVFKTTSLLRHFSFLRDENREVYDVLYKSDSVNLSFFSVIDPASFSTSCVNATYISCKALRMACCIFDENVTLVTPVVDVGEHK